VNNNGVTLQHLEPASQASSGHLKPAALESSGKCVNESSGKCVNRNHVRSATAKALARRVNKVPSAFSVPNVNNRRHAASRLSVNNQAKGRRRGGRSQVPRVVEAFPPNPYLEIGNPPGVPKVVAIAAVPKLAAKARAKCSQMCADREVGNARAEIAKQDSGARQRNSERLGLEFRLEAAFRDGAAERKAA